MDESQAAGLTLRPTALLPRVFKHLEGGNPLYTRLSEIPAGEMALLMGKGTPRSVANEIGGIYQQAGAFNAMPSTQELLRGFTHGKGLKDMFQGVPAKKGDQESYSAPGYVYGQEPMGMGSATSAIEGLLDAAFYGAPPGMLEKYGSTGQGGYLIDKWASRALKKPAGKGQPIYRFVGKKLFRNG